jgi:hypothetical protein
LWLVEIQSVGRTHNAGMRVMHIHARRDTFCSGANCHSVSHFKKLSGQPNWETCAGMSEYPCTGIDKALLKFAVQDRKISQIVSVIVSAFFLTFIRQLLPTSAVERRLASLYPRRFHAN